MLQKVKICWLLLLVFAAGCKAPGIQASKPVSPAEVQVLATIHKFHLTNPNFPYSRINELIKKFDPDLIAVEIRPEDLREDSVYLAQFYPLEMRRVLTKFPLEKVRGLDWYGNEMAGKKLASDVFKNENTELGKIKKLERELNRDSLLLQKLKANEELNQKQVALAKNSSPAILNNGEYDKITDAYYKTLETIMAGTAYETYTNFNRRRDEIISENIVKLVNENPGKKILVLIGANHHSRAIKTLQNLPSEKVKLVPVVD